MMWRGRRGGAGPGPGLVVLARYFVDRVLFLVAACGELALGYDMWAAGSPLEERVYSRRARGGLGDGRAATACLCGAESPSPVFVVALVAGSRLSRGGGSDGVIFPLSVVQSLRLCKKRRICRRIHRHGGYDYVIAPRSGRCPAAATARPSEESV